MLPLPSRGGFEFVRSDRGDALSACAVRCRLFSFRDRRQNALEPVRLAASNAFQFARQLCGANNAAMSTAWARDRDQRHVFTPLHMIASVRLKRRARIYSRSELSRMPPASLVSDPASSANRADTRQRTRVLEKWPQRLRPEP